jgi:hypothetical protein
MCWPRIWLPAPSLGARHLGCWARHSLGVCWPPSLGWPGLKGAVKVSGHALRRLIFGVAVSAARALPVPARCARVVRSVYARPGKLSVADLPTDVASLQSRRYASTGSACALRVLLSVVSKPTTTSTAAAKKVGDHSVVVTILPLVPYAAIPRAAVMEPAALSTVKFASMDSASAPRGLRVAIYAAQAIACAAAVESVAIPH